MLNKVFLQTACQFSHNHILTNYIPFLFTTTCLQTTFPFFPQTHAYKLHSLSFHNHMLTNYIPFLSTTTCLQTTFPFFPHTHALKIACILLPQHTLTNCMRSKWKLPLRGRITYRHCRQPKLQNILASSNTTSWRLMRRANNNNNNQQHALSYQNTQLKNSMPFLTTTHIYKQHTLCYHNTRPKKQQAISYHKTQQTFTNSILFLITTHG